MIVKHISFLSFFLYVILGTSNHIFGAFQYPQLVGVRERSASSLEVSELRYWAQKPERWQDLKRLAKELDSEESRQIEEEQKSAAADVPKNQQFKEAEQRRSDLLWKIEAAALQGSGITINSPLKYLADYCEISCYVDRSDSASREKHSLLHSAVIRRDREDIEFLLGHGADPHLRLFYTVAHELGDSQEKGPSPLDLAVNIGIKGGDRSIVEPFKSFLQKKSRNPGQERKLPEDREEVSV